MKLNWIVAWIVVFVFAVAVMAQTAADRAKKSDEILTKVKHVDLYNQILPLVLTKDQIRKILPALEKARQEVDKTNVKEYEELKKLEPDLDAALKDAKAGNIPSRTCLVKAASTFKGLQMYRVLVAEENARQVIEVFKTTLNEGQKKAAMNALQPELVDPSVDPKKMSDDDKLKFFVKQIILDPETYYLLRDMAK